MFVASLIGIFKFKELPKNYGPFAQHKAKLENRTIKDDDDIAILNIAGTESNHVLFLDSYKNIAAINDELKLVDAKINFNTKKILEGYINE